MRLFAFLFCLHSVPAFAGAECNIDQGVEDCSPVHGTGTRTCQADWTSPTGLSWGDCVIACNSGYVNSGGLCQPAAGPAACCAFGSRRAGVCMLTVPGTGKFSQGDATGKPDCDGVEMPAPPPDTSTSSSTSSSTSTSSASSTAMSVQTASAATDAAAIHAHAADASSSQTESIKASLEVVSLGASHGATAGALFCAESLNALDSNPELAAADAGRCQQSYDSAYKMEAMGEKLGGQKGFKPDQSVLDQPGSREILAETARRMGLSAEEYLHLMLGKGGGPGAMKNLLDSASAEKFAAALEEGKSAERDPSGGTLAGDAAAAPAKPGKGAGGVRDALRARLSESAKADRPVPGSSARVAVSLGRKIAAEKLTPLEDPLFSPEVARELTLFDIVHRKYQEKFPMLVPYRVDTR